MTRSRARVAAAMVLAGLVLTGPALAGCTSGGSGSRASGSSASDSSTSGSSASGSSATGSSATGAPASSGTDSPPGVSPSGSSASGSPVSAAGDWFTYHGDAQRQGLSQAMPAASGRLTVEQVSLDGQVYASPLIIGSTVVVATENNVVYGLSTSGAQLWKVALASPTPASALACGDITPIGITGTPVYDRSSGSVFFVTSTGKRVVQTLVALDPATGAVKFQRPLAFEGVDPNAMQQRGALAVTGGMVWIPFGARSGDCGNYQGRVIGVPVTGSGQQVHYSPPTKRGGGIWNPMGVVVNGAGHLLVVSANGAAFPGDSYDHTNTLLELDGVRVVDSFAPSDWAQNNRADVGLGSQGATLVGGRWIFIGGKSQTAYVLRQGALGGIGGEVSQQNLCRSFGGTAVLGDVVYVPCTDGERAVRITAAGTMQVLWHADEVDNGSPVVGGGRVYVLNPAGGKLNALDPTTGAVRESATVGETNRFASPAISGSKLFVPTLAGLSVVDTA